MIIHAIPLVGGSATGAVVALAEPLSFWGGFDVATGRVIDQRHPDRGRSLTGCVVAVTAARGSSSGASVLAEAIRCGTAPAAFVLSTRDAILTVGAEVARELYGRACPIVVVTHDDLQRVRAAAHAAVACQGTSGTITLTL